MYKRLTKSELILKDYDGIFQKQMDDGIIERVLMGEEGFKGLSLFTASWYDT